MERALHMIDAARARGLAVTADIYPYIAGSTTMTSLFPAWTLEGGMERFLARIADPATRQRIIDEVQGGREGWSRANGSVGWDDIVVSSCQNQKAFEGKTVAQIAAAMGQDPAHAMMDFLVAEEGTASIIMFMMSEENVARGIAHPHVMIGSDSWPWPRARRQTASAHLWHLPACWGNTYARRKLSRWKTACAK